MKKINKIIVISITTWLSFTAIADGHIEAPTYLPLEGFACNYNSGKDLGDFMKATEKWNDYVDETGVAYNAWVFTPYFYSEDQKADFLLDRCSPNMGRSYEGSRNYGLF